MITIYMERDTDYPGEHVFVPRDSHGQQVADAARERQQAHDNANDSGYMHTQDASK
ncbi:MAG: hypothetical protein J6N20_09585 [Pseudomonas sp.]|nr:hypothetical protein [Pseudomonas sp.]